jgi:Tfp pilus assembly protein PilX
MYALRHKPVPTPALAGNSPASERGVVLLVALIILVALTLAGVALIRSVDTANIIAGNLSFRESAVHAGERHADRDHMAGRQQQHNAAFE